MDRAVLLGEWLSARHGRLQVVPHDNDADLLVRSLGTNEPHGIITVENGQMLLRREPSAARAAETPAILNVDLSAEQFIIWSAASDDEDTWDSWDRRFLQHLRGAWSQATALFPQFLEASGDDWMAPLDLCYQQIPDTSVGLCTTCHNRLWQLSVALPISLLFSWPWRRSCTFHVLDYGSKDPEPERPEGERSCLMFLIKTCRIAMDAGLLKVHRCEATHWHASIAKNSVHLVATEGILVNLDADNIAGPGFVLDVLQRFQRPKLAAAHYRTEGVPGTVGRIACRRADFLELQGYDEDAHPSGAQDLDFWMRLAILARRRRQLLEKESDPLKATAIRNSMEQKVRFCQSNLPWGAMNEGNWATFERRREQGQLIRNSTKWGLRSVQLHFKRANGSVYLLRTFSSD